MSEKKNFQKMVFRAYKDTEHKEKNADNSLQYEALINPASISRSFGCSPSGQKERGATDSSGKKMGLDPETLSFDLLLDGTGIVSTKRTDVAEEIRQFMNVVFTDPENKEQPKYVEIIYGKTFNVLCELTQLKIDYQLFQRDGSPLRAKLSCSFTRVAKPQKTKKEQPAKKSASLTEKVLDCYDTILSKAKEAGCNSIWEWILHS